MSEPRYRHVDSRIEQGVLVVSITEPSLQGEDLNRQVGKELQMAVDDTGIVNVVIDFAKVKFLTSLGIQALLNFRRHLRPRDGQLVLCNASAGVADILLTTHVASATESAVIPFRLAPDVGTAIGRLTNAGTEP
jgi:anti-anti-sigma factor